MGPPPIIRVVLIDEEKNRGAFLEMFEILLLAKVADLDNMSR